MSTRYNDGSHYENHQRAAELQEIAEHAHRAGEQNHNKQGHLTGHEHTRQSLEHSPDGHGNSHSATVGHGIAAFGHEDIASVAHELWEVRGCPIGSPEIDWFEAVKELRTRAVSGKVAEDTV